MRILFLVSVCLLAVQPARGQSSDKWRFSGFATAPTRLLEVNSAEFPDSNTNRVGLGVGYGVSAARVWVLQPRLTASLRAGVMTASVSSTTGGTKWAPGRAFVIDGGARVERGISARTALFAGAGASHWSGPDRTSPFTGLGALQVGGEAGLSVRPGEGAYRLDFTANLTRFAPDDTRNVATGFIWRWMVEIRRGR